MTTTANTATALENLTYGYGPTWIMGIISEHLDRAVAAGGRVHRTATNRMYVAPATGGRAIPVLCSELVAIDTEDGPISGRCGIPALATSGACAGHTEQIAAWRAQSEAEIIAWERDLDRF